jgi:DNA repair protein RadC
MSQLLRLLPNHERPRERLLRHGAATLADRELLALVLRSGTSSTSAIDLAASIVHAQGSLQRLASAQVDELKMVNGVGAAKASSVAAAFELGRRVVAPASLVLDSSEHVAAAARPYLMGVRHERLVLLVADSGLRLIRTHVVSEGTVNATLFSPRDILQAVLRCDGHAFALAHNHPGGSITPSAQDVQSTHGVAMAADVVGIRFLEHIIVTDDDWSVVLDRQ